ncbi:MAG: chromosomal replication initiator protein DnaA [Roseibacillus sp.]|nr:chromosomal replication initiator protein DnaA [Roseibacillus sp.]
MSSRDEGGVSAPSGTKSGEVAARSGARISTEEARTQILRLLDARLSGDATERWFKHMQLVVEDANQVTVFVPTETHVLWIQENFLPELTHALSQVLGCGGRPRVLAMNGAAGGQLSLLEEPQKQSRAKEVAAEALAKSLKSAGLNPLYTFDRFVVGGNNQFAHAACKAIAAGVRTAYNPLFIHGGSGLGKTHLMQAIGQDILKARPDSKVIYLTCEKFTNEFILAVQKGNLDNFRRRYRRANVLLVDDVQFLNGKEKSQEEFFHTFNTLLDGRAQVVLSSDRPASEIQTLEPRLVSRFECGLTVALQPPQLETRIAILRRKMEEWEVKIPEDWVRFIAQRIRSNVRRLEGALVRIATFNSLGQGELSTDRIEDLLRDILREEAAAKVTIDTIQKTVADYYDIRLADMTSRRRPANIAFPRQIAMYLSRKLTGGSLVEIGEAFGGRDHGTVIHACKKVEQMMQTDDQVRQTVAALGARLNR